jgi:hypothetical protein
LTSLVAEFWGVRERTGNSERILVFCAVVLQTTPGVLRARDIRARILNRLDLWKKGAFESLCTDTESEAQGGGLRAP